jgi:hypothetical protein
VTENIAQIRLHLYLRSTNLTPEEISEELGVPFDQCHRVGEPRGKSLVNEHWWEQHKRYWEEHWWILHEIAESTYARTYDDLPVVLDRLLKRVEQSWQTFSRLASGGLGELSIVISCDGYPGMGFESELLQRISRLNLYMDFDLYCEPECKRIHAD